MNLQELRAYVRMQLDMDEEELPNGMLDSFFSEAFMRTISMENRWPFLEASWNAIKIGAEAGATLPTSCDPAGLFSVIDAKSKLRLVQVSNEQAEDNINGLGLATNPVFYTIWGNQLRLWPNPEDDRSLNLRGYRYPREWLAEGPEAVPDCDPRLHILLAHYAIALVYAQQEDEVLEDTYMKRWQSGFLSARNAICNPRHHRPLVLNGGLPLTNVVAGARMNWGPPVGP